MGLNNNKKITMLTSKAIFYEKKYGVPSHNFVKNNFVKKFVRKR
jgi:hypothetical protein